MDPNVKLICIAIEIVDNIILWLLSRYFHVHRFIYPISRGYITSPSYIVELYKPAYRKGIKSKTGQEMQKRL